MSDKSSSGSKQKRRSDDEPSGSTNRAVKKKRNCGRNPNFDTDETQLLLQLWGDPKVQRDLFTAVKKHGIFGELAVKMEEQGYYRSAEEIRTRIKNVKYKYNRLKKEMVTNRSVVPSWEYYFEMDAIMTRPIFSVRPNEVPAPSLKYSLAMAREERDERRKKALEDGDSISEDSFEYFDP